MMISGVVTLAAFVCFIGITLWACSRRNRRRFESAAQLPLLDEDSVPACCRKGAGS